MIVTRTPLRVSFFGGGSDIPEYWEHGDGLCVSAAINKYIYIAANRCATDHVRVVYSEMEVVKDINDIKHDRVRETLKLLNIKSNIEICSFSDVPTKGTGLGSSSTFTVGLINALMKGELDKSTLAEAAADIEIKMCKEPIGYQDQYAAAYGDLKSYRFNNDNHVEVSKIYTNSKFILQDNLLCFNTGINRQASAVLKGQVENLKNGINVETTKSMVNIAQYSIQLLENDRVDDFGALLNETWALKKKLSTGISNPTIDEMYDRVMKAGALGGKLLGAGGGGYLLAYVPNKYRVSVLEAMKDYERFDFKFDLKGTKVEMNA